VVKAIKHQLDQVCAAVSAVVLAVAMEAPARQVGQLPLIVVEAAGAVLGPPRVVQAALVIV